MKKRIVALILTVVTTLLVFTSCGTYNFAKEDLGAYATFNYEDFKAALANIKVKDGEFSANPATREQYVKDKIYNAVADKMIAAATDSEKLEEGLLDGGDALYFVYYAVDAEGNVFFTSDMQENALTGTNKANHVIKLGDVNEDSKFMVALKTALDANNVDVKDYIYSALLASEIKSKAEEEFEAKWEEEHPTETPETPETTDGESSEEENDKSDEDAKKEALAAYIEEALKVKDGQIIVVSYTRTYKNEKDETVTETATYETLGVAGADAELYAKLIELGAKVGNEVKVSTNNAEKPTETTNKFECGKYTYESVTVKYVIENFKPIVEFKYTPYEKVEDESKKTALVPDNGHVKDEKVTLNEKELTYYVFPLYYIDIPSYDKVSASDILTYVYGSSLKTTSFDVLADEAYKNGDTKVTDLVADVAKIYSTKIVENQEFFDKYADLKAAVENYNKSSSNATYKAELEKQRLIVLKEYVGKIIECSNGTDKIGDLIGQKYYDSVFYAAAVSYETDMTAKIEEAIWDLIEKHVKLTGEYPKKLVKEFKKHITDQHEQTYYTGKAGSVAHVDAYKTFDDYLMQNVYKVANMDAVDAAITAEAEALIKPMIQIYVVAKACEADALRVLGDYVEADINGGVYNTSATEKDEESIEFARTMSDYFLVNNKYLRAYKKAIGKENYKYYIQTYGETNFSVALQFDKLFYYLTSFDVKYNEEKKTVNAVIEDGKIQFRNEFLNYTVE